MPRYHTGAMLLFMFLSFSFGIIVGAREGVVQTIKAYGRTHPSVFPHAARLN